MDVYLDLWVLVLIAGTGSGLSIVEFMTLGVCFSCLLILTCLQLIVEICEALCLYILHTCNVVYHVNFHGFDHVICAFVGIGIGSGYW